MADLVEKVTTDLTFHEGRLVPAGATVFIDADKVQLDPGDGTPHNPGNAPNLADPANAVRMVAVPVAPIAPTGPFPTAPQQVPPGVLQTSAGYHTPDGALLVASGSQAAADAAANGDAMEEEAPIRRNSSQKDAGLQSREPAAVPPAAPVNSMDDADRAELAEFRRQRDERQLLGQGGGEDASGSASGEGFNPDAVIDGTVPDVSKRLEGLTREQLVAVRAAEQDREQPRQGVSHAIDAAVAKLDAASDDV